MDDSKTSQSALTRADKNTVTDLVAYIAPEFLKILNDCKNVAAWKKLSDRLAEQRAALQVNDYYVLYADEKRIAYILLRALMSHDEIKQQADEFNAVPREEQQVFLHELAKPGGLGEQFADEIFPDDEATIKKQVAEFEQMPDGPEKQELVKRSGYFFAFFLAWFHQTLSIMTHGEKLTSLVPKAVAGDKDALLLAIHIDKALITLHPAFVEIYQQATRDGDKAFLDKVSYRLAAPITRGRVKLAGIFVVFALLESLDWLNDLKHREILAICDEANLDRWDNRIEDETAVSKALAKYRRYQKTGGLSMH